MEKRFHGFAFGRQAARFSLISLPPVVRSDGLHGAGKLGPESYEIHRDFDEKYLKERAKGPGWKEEVDAEEYSRLPQVMKKHIFSRKKEDANKRGPGKYNVVEDIAKHAKGISAIRGERFKFDTRNVLGPGTYGDPNVRWENALKKTQMDIKGIMHSPVKRQFFALKRRGKGPGLYDFTNPTDQILKKVVSLKGPYNLFTKNRDNSTLHGYQTMPESWPHLCPGMYKVPTFVDEMNKPEKIKHGEFLKDQRFRYNMEVTLGPGQYDPVLPKIKRDFDTGVPFNSSAPRKPIMKDFTLAGPETYTIERDPIMKFGCESSFRSSGKKQLLGHMIRNITPAFKTVAPCYRHLLVRSPEEMHYIEEAKIYYDLSKSLNC